MAYLLEIGPVNELKIIKQAVRCGEQIPDRIANPPKLDFGLEVYLNAFLELDSERPRHFGVGPIPRSAISQYANDFGFEDEERDDLHFFIRQMDNDYLKRESAKTKGK